MVFDADRDDQLIVVAALALTITGTCLLNGLMNAIRTSAAKQSNIFFVRTFAAMVNEFCIFGVMSFVMFGLNSVPAISLSRWGPALHVAHLTLLAVGSLLVANCAVMLSFMGRAMRYYGKMAHAARHSTGVQVALHGDAAAAAATTAVNFIGACSAREQQQATESTTTTAATAAHLCASPAALYRRNVAAGGGDGATATTHAHAPPPVIMGDFIVSADGQQAPVRMPRGDVAAAEFLLLSSLFISVHALPLSFDFTAYLERRICTFVSQTVDVSPAVWMGSGAVVGLSLLLFNGITAVLGPFGAFLCATACGWLLLLIELLLLRQSHAIYAKMLQLIGLERLADVSSMTVLTPARHLLVMLSIFVLFYLPTTPPLLVSHSLLYLYCPCCLLPTRSRCATSTARAGACAPSGRASSPRACCGRGRPPSRPSTSFTRRCACSACCSRPRTARGAPCCGPRRGRTASRRRGTAGIWQQQAKSPPPQGRGRAPGGGPAPCDRVCPP